MEKIGAAVIGVLLFGLVIILGSAAAGILRVREAQKKEDAGKWQETDGAGSEKK